MTCTQNKNEVKLNWNIVIKYLLSSATYSDISHRTRLIRQNQQLGTIDKFPFDKFTFFWTNHCIVNNIEAPIRFKRTKLADWFITCLTFQLHLINNVIIRVLDLTWSARTYFKQWDSTGYFLSFDMCFLLNNKT